MMSIDNVARNIIERHGIPRILAERIARAAAHRRHGSTGGMPAAPASTMPPFPEGRQGSVTLGELAQEISAVATIPIGDAVLIANLVVARVAPSLAPALLRSSPPPARGGAG